MSAPTVNVPAGVAEFLGKWQNLMALQQVLELRDYIGREHTDIVLAAAGLPPVAAVADGGER